MERRPIPLGLAAAVAAYAIAKIIKLSLTFFFDDPFSGPLPSLLLDAIYSLPWLAGGFVAGYFSSKKPLKDGASTGIIYGVIYCLIGIAMLASQTHELQDRLWQLHIAVTAIIRFAFLFTLAAALGHTIKDIQRISN